MITEEQLDTLAAFCKESDDSYCDRWKFSIIPSNEEKTEWSFWLFSEVDGSNRFIKYLKDFDDLKNVYRAIENEELAIIEN
jgi:hypothetical protein